MCFQVEWPGRVLKGSLDAKHSRAVWCSKSGQVCVLRRCLCSRFRRFWTCCPTKVFVIFVFFTNYLFSDLRRICSSGTVGWYVAVTMNLPTLPMVLVGALLIFVWVLNECNRLIIKSVSIIYQQFEYIPKHSTKKTRAKTYWFSKNSILSDLYVLDYMQF